MYRLFMGKPICLSETLKGKGKSKWILAKELTCYEHLYIEKKLGLETYDR